MKCIKLDNGDIVRTTDSKAEKLVETKTAKYVNKKLWKETKDRKYLK